MSSILKETFLREKLLYNYSLKLSDTTKSLEKDNEEAIEEEKLSEEVIAQGLST